jgi:hypothetical protein
VGAFALAANTAGGGNVAIGGGALYFSTIEGNNVATGTSALSSNTSGSDNIATSQGALFSDTTGHDNIATGYQSLFSNTTGSNDTFLGYNTGPTSTTRLSNATAVGANAQVGASNSLVLGDDSVNVGIHTSTLQSAFQLAGSGSSYGTYFQLPVVSNASAPPAADCNTSTFVGRMVLQSTSSSQVSLWICSPGGTWVNPS